MPITDIQCKTAKPKEKTWRMSDGAGMYLEIAPGGAKYWRMKYRFAGKEKRLSFGVYPEVSLLEARDRRDQARRLLRDGKDPLEVRREGKRLAIIQANNTFEKLAREWHERYKSRWTESSARDILRRLEIDIFPVLGGRPVTSLTPPEVMDAIRKIEARGAHEIARRALQYCGRVLRYGVARGILPSDPTRDLKDELVGFRKGHFAALESKDLPKFLSAVDRNEARLYSQTINALRFLMLTFVRTSEMINAPWDEFDLEDAIWTIPAERMKMRREHIVPLSRQALEILEKQRILTGHRKWVFPNIARSEKTMSNGTILMALRRLGYAKRMTGHGFRALAMTTLKEELGYRHEVIDRQLAHVPGNSVDKAYDRALFLKERIKMMQDYSDYLDKVKRA